MVTAVAVLVTKRNTPVTSRPVIDNACRERPRSTFQPHYYELRHTVAREIDGSKEMWSQKVSAHRTTLSLLPHWPVRRALDSADIHGRWTNAA